MNTKPIMWGIRILLGGLFILAGINKLMNGAGEDVHLLEIYKQIGKDPMLAASMAEVGGGVGLFLPMVAPYATFLLIIIMIIATGISMMIGGIQAAAFPLIILVVLILLTFLNKKNEL